MSTSGTRSRCRARAKLKVGLKKLACLRSVVNFLKEFCIRNLVARTRTIAAYANLPNQGPRTNCETGLKAIFSIARFLSQRPKISTEDVQEQASWCCWLHLLHPPVFAMHLAVITQTRQGFQRTGSCTSLARARGSPLPARDPIYLLASAVRYHALPLRQRAPREPPQST